MPAPPAHALGAGALACQSKRTAPDRLGFLSQIYAMEIHLTPGEAAQPRADSLTHEQHPVIPTGTDQRKAMICEVEGPAVSPVRSKTIFDRGTPKIWRCNGSNRTCRPGAFARWIP